MMGEVDPLDFLLAEKLGKTLAEIRGMPHAEFVEWRAFYTYRHAMENPRKVV